jgi:hypothetical protein
VHANTRGCQRDWKLWVRPRNEGEFVIQGTAEEQRLWRACFDAASCAAFLLMAVPSPWKTLSTRKRSQSQRLALPPEKIYTLYIVHFHTTALVGPDDSNSILRFGATPLASRYFPRVSRQSEHGGCELPLKPLGARTLFVGHRHVDGWGRRLPRSEVGVSLDSV